MILPPLVFRVNTVKFVTVVIYKCNFYQILQGSSKVSAVEEIVNNILLSVFGFVFFVIVTFVRTTFVRTTFQLSVKKTRGRHDTQHNGIQYNDTVSKGITCDIQHNGTQHKKALPLC